MIVFFAESKVNICASPQVNWEGSWLQMTSSWGTKKKFWLTLAPENNTAKLYMVEKVIIWGI